MKICDKRKLALASKNHNLISRYKRLFGTLDLSGADLSNLDLRNANLRDANLCGVDLRGANLRGANLRDANLRGANMHYADMRDSNLCGANLRNADLSDANLRCANLSGADLSGANLRGADLSYANLIDAKKDNIKINSESIFYSLQCPEEGSFIAWKKCRNNVIVKLLIPEDARRSSATSRKCRAEFVDVLDVIGAEFGISQHDNNVKYCKGERVHCDNWNKNRWVASGGGIHFFLTRAEAESY